MRYLLACIDSKPTSRRSVQVCTNMYRSVQVCVYAKATFVRSEYVCIDSKPTSRRSV